MSLLRSAIGRVLRRIRHDQGRTLQDVARAAGVSMPYLSEIERGRKEASSEILAGICRALGIDLPDLLALVRAELLRTAVMGVTAGIRHRTDVRRHAGSRPRPTPSEARRHKRPAQAHMCLDAFQNPHNSKIDSALDRIGAH